MKYFILLLLFLNLLAGCKEEGTNTQEFPPGHQFDIPWPSLADSPWPMHHHDPQSTGRSKFIGPKMGLIDWNIDNLSILTGVSISDDSLIHFITNNPTYLYGVKYNSNIQFMLNDSIETVLIYSTPLIGKNNTIFFIGGSNGKLYAADKNGKIKWIYQADGFANTTGINIGLDGTIYFISSDKVLNAVADNGLLKWKLYNQNFNTSTSSGVSISPDGKTIYVPGITPSLYSVDIETKSINWSFGDSWLPGLPVIDCIGNIYIQAKSNIYNSGKAAAYCLNTDGTVRWSYVHNNSEFRPTSFAEGCIDKQGNYYFAFDTLYSINYSGKLNWSVGLKGYSGGPVICDAEGNIYLNKWEDGLYIIALNSKGNLIFDLQLGNEIPGPSPAIGNNNRIFFATFKSKHFFTIN